MLRNLFKKNKTVKKFQDEDNTLITYEDLSKLPLNEVVQINKELKGAIECIRISSNTNNTLMFTVTMKKNQLWEKHYHDCSETCVVFKGKLKDINSNKVAKTAETLSFLPYEPHYVIAEENSIFYVEFKKPPQK